MRPSNFHCVTEQSEISPPLIPAATSTPVANAPPSPTQVITVETLSTVISDLAKQIGDNITANLSVMQHNKPVQSQPAERQPSEHNEQLRVVIQPEAKAPPYFRGDQTDTFSIDEWEDMMRCYLSRLNCGSQQAFDLVMSRLMGKARDVVKVSLRCHPTLSDAELMDVVFDILKRNFSELTFSDLPMKDFYNTLPFLGEDAMDYWIRLNKAMDVAIECLRRRGRLVENPSAEVVMMFINHCPDARLALSFQLKDPHEWTAAEVQKKLDSYLGKIKSSVPQSKHGLSQTIPSQNALSFTCQSQLDSNAVAFPTKDQHCHPSQVSQSTNVNGQHQSVGDVRTPQHSTVTADSAANTFISSQPIIEHATQQMVNMFDKVLSLCTSSLTTDRRRQQQNGRPHGQQKFEHFPCKVCSSKDHTTHAHCRLFRLCLNCFGSGHVKRDCTLVAQKPPTVVPSSSTDLN